MPDVDTVEEAEINAYMEPDESESPSREEQINYYRARYEQVKNEYKLLVLQKGEAEARKNEDILNRITTAFRENYKTRKVVVKELRTLGEPVEDRVVPIS